MKQTKNEIKLKNRETQNPTEQKMATKNVGKPVKTAGKREIGANIGGTQLSRSARFDTAAQRECRERRKWRK